MKQKYIHMKPCSLYAARTYFQIVLPQHKAHLDIDTDNFNNLRLTVSLVISTLRS